MVITTKTAMYLFFCQIVSCLCLKQAKVAETGKKNLDPSRRYLTKKPQKHHRGSMRVDRLKNHSSETPQWKKKKAQTFQHNDPSRHLLFPVWWRLSSRNCLCAAHLPLFVVKWHPPPSRGGGCQKESIILPSTHTQNALWLLLLCDQILFL